MNASGPRGLAPRGPWRVFHSERGAVAVDDDGDRVCLQDRPAQVLQVLSRRIGATSTDELLADLETPPEHLADLARDLADLVRAGVVVRSDTTPPALAVLGVGSADTTDLRSALQGQELHDEASADLLVLCCDDHAAPELGGVLAAETKDRAVLLVRWGAGRCWIGPLLEPGDGHREFGTCARCLLESLQRNVGSIGSAGVADGDPVLRRAQAGLVAGVVRGLVGEGFAAWRTRIREIDVRTTDVDTHPVAGCCDRSRGDVDTFGRSELLDQLAPRTSTLTGILAPPTVRVSTVGWYLATTTHPVRSRSLGPGAPWRRATAFGAGRTREEALTSCVGEAVERFSTSWRPDPAARTGTVSQVRGEGGEVWTDAELRHDVVPPGGVDQPGESEEEVEFRPLRTLGGGGRHGVWVPAASVTFGHPDARGARPDSSGCAAGRTIPDAVRRGLTELLERDAVALWWWPRQSRPGLPLSLLGDDLRVRLAGDGRTAWLLDLTTDVGVPVVVAVSVRDDGTGTTLGFGAAPSYAAAACRAAAELLQVLACLEFADELGLAGAVSPQWQALDGRTLEFLRPHGELELTPAEEVPRSDDDVLRAWSARLALAAVDVGWLDLTDPSVGIPVVRVVSRQLRPWYRRLGPGRLRLNGPENPWDLPV